MANDTPNSTRPSTPYNGTGASTPNPAIPTIHNLRVGCKVHAHKDDELRQAEILSIQTRQGEPHFYVHYKEYNKVLPSLVSVSDSVAFG
jgi:RNA binding activity-knot of a chromodomain